MINNPYSDLKIFYHPEKLFSLKEEAITTAPIYVRLKPTNRCNHRCSYCSYADTDLNLRTEVIKSDEIPWDILQKTINEFGEIGVRAITLSGGGEPLIYPKINECMKLINKNKIELSIITNGQCLKGDSARILAKSRWVRISLDSPNKQLFSETRGVNPDMFDDLVTNIKNFVKIKNKNCEFGVNYVIHHENVSFIYDMTKLCKELGINHIKFAPRITKDVIDYHRLIEMDVYNQLKLAKQLEDDNFRVIDKYTGDFEEAAKYQRNYTFCPIMQITTVIGADCKVYMCHDKAYVKDGVIGDLKENSFKDIWFSDKTRELFYSFNPIDKCKHHCMNDNRNTLINRYLNVDIRHIDFI